LGPLRHFRDLGHFGHFGQLENPGRMAISRIQVISQISVILVILVIPMISKGISKGKKEFCLFKLRGSCFLCVLLQAFKDCTMIAWQMQSFWCQSFPQTPIVTQLIAII
jgi:hypothetical protein